MTRSARYIGKPKTRQLGGGNWLDPGVVITKPPATVDALLELDDFEEVDLSTPPDYPDAESEDDASDYPEDEEE